MVTTQSGSERREIVLVDGTRVVLRISTRHQRKIYYRDPYTWTHVDRRLADDLEDFADELGVLQDHERLVDPPVCSRCRCREVEVFEFGGYVSLCFGCTTWSRATRATATAVRIAGER
jgi:hypothetical protein